MDEHVAVKKEPAWYGEPPHNVELRESVPIDETEAPANVGGGGCAHRELGGIGRLAQSSYSAAINLAHVMKVKQEVQADVSQALPNFRFVDVSVDGVPPSDVGCGQGIDPLQVMSHPSKSCEAWLQSRHIKQEAPDGVKRELPDPQSTSIEVSGSPLVILQSDHGGLSSPTSGRHSFGSVIGLLQVKQDGKSEPDKNADKTTANDPSMLEDSSSEVQGNVGKPEVSPQFSLQAGLSRVNQATRSGKYTCDTCGVNLRSRTALNQHVRLHSSGDKHKYEHSDAGNTVDPTEVHSTVKPLSDDQGEKRLTLSFELSAPNQTKTIRNCDKGAANFSQHTGIKKETQISHKGQNLNDCNVSKEKFSKRSHLIIHKSSHTRDKLFACNLCEARFATRTRLITHTKLHAGCKLYVCDMCSEGFTKKCTLIIHIRSHIGEKSFACNICNARFITWSGLIEHNSSHTGTKRFACDMCGAKCSSNSTLITHKRSHTGEKLFACDMCDGRFSHKCNLTIHKRSHTGEKPFSCDVCVAMFSSSSSLTKHKRSHTGQKPFACDMCGARFTHSGNLRVHKRSHSGEKPFACDMCKARFTQNSTLTKHKTSHTGEKPFACDLCDARFTENSNLTIHKRSHTGEKPFSCDVCAAKFSSSSSLIKHKKSHTGEKPFACDLCDARFTQSCNLKTHRTSHTGEKPFSCDMCEARFTTRSHLSRHKRSHN